MKTLRFVCAASILLCPAMAAAQVATPVPAPAPASEPAPPPVAAPGPTTTPFVVRPKLARPVIAAPMPFGLDGVDLYSFPDAAGLQVMDAEHQIELSRRQIEVVKGDLYATGADAYNSALGALQRRQYDRAITQFERAIKEKGQRADGAMYWTAFAHFRSGRSAEALDTIAVLRRDYPQSRYLTDAKVLETDARRLGGQSVDLADLDNDDLKLLAIQGLRNSDEVVPLLEDVLAATNSLAVKARALYVLALSEDTRTRAILLRYAQGGGNPDLQVAAVRYLTARPDADSSTLIHLYGSQADTRVRLAIIHALARPEHAESLVVLARQETDRELKTEIVQRLSVLAPRSQAAAQYLVELIK